MNIKMDNSQDFLLFKLLKIMKTALILKLLPYIILIIILLLIQPIAYAGLIEKAFTLNCYDSHGKECFNPVEDNWYSVDDWEIQVCKYWGGPQNQISAMSTYNPFISQLTATVQAEKEVLLNNDTLYKISYFVIPLTGKINYSLMLYNTTNAKSFYLVNNSVSSARNGASGYFVHLDTNSSNYDVAQLVMTPGGILTVPVISQEYDNSCSFCGFVMSGTP